MNWTGTYMLCRKPFMAGAVPFGCGQCMPCRINRRRKWSYRMFFESLMHEHNAFVTLTYADDKLPPNGSLQPEEITKWMKRLRQLDASIRIRYFLVGEYGDASWRPHYHAALFGVSPFEPIARRSLQSALEQSWPHGFVMAAEFNEKTAQYVAGYVTKKLTAKDDPRLAGRYPEFARMSLRPGLGATAMETLARTICQSPQASALLDANQFSDVPNYLMLGKRKVPIDRYMLRKLREYVGFTEEYVAQLKAAKTHERSEELLALFNAALQNQAFDPVTPKGVYLQTVAGKLASVEARSKIHESRRSI